MRIASGLKKIFATAVAVTALGVCPGTGLRAEPDVPQSGKIMEVSLDSEVAPKLALLEFGRTCPPVAARSRHSLYIEGLQKEFGRLPGHLPLVILDHDELERCQGYLAVSTTMTGKFMAYVAAVAQAVRQTGGIDLSTEDVQGRAMAMLDNKVSAETFFDDKKNAVLMVLVPSNPDVSIYDTLRDFSETDFNRKGYDFLQDMFRSQKVISVGTFRLWADAHEIVHALDRHYQLEIWRAEGFEALWLRHKAEMYADVASILYMAARGETQDADFARTIADLRTVNTLSDNSRNADDRLALNQLGAVYHTAPGLRSAANYISGAGEDIKGMTIEEIMDAAQGIVEDSAFSREEMKAVIRYINQGAGYLQALSAEPDGAAKDAAFRAVEAYAEEVYLSRERIRRQVEDYHDRLPTQRERDEVVSGLYSDFIAEARLNDKMPEDFARRVSETKDELRSRFVYGASTIDEEEASKSLEDVTRAVVDFTGELAEKSRIDAKPLPKPSLPQPPR